MGEWTKALDMRVAALEEKDVDAKNKMEALDMIVTALEVYVEKVGEDSPEDSPQDLQADLDLVTSVFLQIIHLIFECLKKANAKVRAVILKVQG
ncbi:hypothetical protein F2Q70_00029938 [Brassica cretica]|uniref:Uncharacterized protein n=2 Tax=Brassica cretica TaxID=69181 RepID=A0A3N6RWR1_BRACR|nr:hypothetical protein F2Q70_00029938 [Brassica cretica]KAF2550233.1 hypothetical protein F2Q68_00034410 [Brassica cretica]KAF3489197.1 hypothetical protein F2Q69_00053202 [Brassica cretica]KAF3593287.1 hypothetical protein DY000_02022219 [Brassica cretica]